MQPFLTVECSWCRTLSKRFQPRAARKRIRSGVTPPWILQARSWRETTTLFLACSSSLFFVSAYFPSSYFRLLILYSYFSLTLSVIPSYILPPLLLIHVLNLLLSLCLLLLFSSPCFAYSLSSYIFYYTPTATYSCYCLSFSSPTSLLFPISFVLTEHSDWVVTNLLCSPKVPVSNFGRKANYTDWGI